MSYKKLQKRTPKERVKNAKCLISLKTRFCSLVENEGRNWWQITKNYKNTNVMFSMG